jgi:hypothetical protein
MPEVWATNCRARSRLTAEPRELATKGLPVADRVFRKPLETTAQKPDNGGV